jgi:hypothetical protein
LAREIIGALQPIDSNDIPQTEPWEVIAFPLGILATAKLQRFYRQGATSAPYYFWRQKDPPIPESLPG